MNRETPKSSYWLRLGAMIDRKSPQHATSFTMLVVGAFVLVLTVSFVGVIVGSYQERLERDSSRAPTQFAAGGESTSTGARWSIVADEAEGRWVHVFIIAPGEGVNPPPGLSEWPEPGEVILAPALDGTAAGNEIIHRYGLSTGKTISLEGLVSPSERIAYVRPNDKAIADFKGLSLSRMGSPFEVNADSQGFFGGAAYQRSVYQALFGYGLAILLPAIILMAVASRAGSSQRDRRLQVIKIMGAGRREILSVLSGSVLRPIVVGGVLALVVLTIIAFTGLYVPVAGYFVQAIDVQAHIPLVLICALLGWGLALALTLLLNRPRRSQGTRPHPSPVRERWWKLALLPLACIAMVQGLVATLEWEDAPLRIFVIYGGILIVALCLPSFIGGTSALAARLLVRAGTKLGSPGLMISGRQILADSRSVRRLGTGLALMVLLVAHAFCLSTMTNSLSRQAEKVQQQFGTEVVSIDGALSRDEVSQAVRASLDGRADLISISGGVTELGPEPAVLIAECPTLKRMSIACTDGSVPQESISENPELGLLLNVNGTDAAEVRIGDPLASVDPDDEEPAAIYALGIENVEALEAVRSELAHTVLPSPSVSLIGGEWLTGLQESRDQALWNIVGATIATLLLGLAITGAALGDSSAHARRVGVVSMWGAGASFSATLVFGRVLMPLVVATMTGSSVAFLTTVPYGLPPMNAQLPGGFFVACVALPLVASLAVAGLAVRTQQKVLSTWRPRGDY
ncbi:FtsX-like permease family protein [Brachybacterium alimentarium]|uniref:FtsX-like permease family protein n=1 Tax=Brachybacterium alimentarium TaxID=47845 RepID=UPI003FD371F2